VKLRCGVVLSSRKKKRAIAGSIERPQKKSPVPAKTKRAFKGVSSCSGRSLNKRGIKEISTAVIGGAKDLQARRASLASTSLEVPWEGNGKKIRARDLGKGR